MADFNDAHDYVLESQVKGYNRGEYESSYFCDPDDPSHYASGILMGMNWGITAQEYAVFLGHVPPRNAIRHLTYEESAAVHHDLYWLPIQGDQIKSQAIANILMDAYHHTGRYSIKILQCLCRSYGKRSVRITGAMDRKTIKALNEITDKYEAAFYNRFTQARKQLLLYVYQKDVDPDWQRCFKVWKVSCIDELPQGSYSKFADQLARVGRAGGMLVKKDKVHVDQPRPDYHSTKSRMFVFLLGIISILLLYLY